MKVSLDVKARCLIITSGCLLSVLDNKNGSPYLFYQRQFWSCVKVCVQMHTMLWIVIIYLVLIFIRAAAVLMFPLFLVAGQRLDVGRHLIHILPEGPGPGQHSEPIHPLSAADHRHGGRERPKVPKGGKRTADVRANTFTAAA